MPDHLNVAAIQHACSQSKQDNLQLSIENIHSAANAGAELIVLPELHTTPYFCHSQNTEHFDLAESIPGPSIEQLAAAAKALNIVVVASVFERRTAGLYHNTAVVLEKDGSIAGLYRKMHIPDDPGYNEKFYFTPGDLGFTPINTSVGKLGVLVCWDQWFPEAARLMSLAGAEILIYPTAIGHNPADEKSEQQRQLDAWITVQRGHAIANGLPLISCNRIGKETPDGDTFWGHSFICGPQGEFLAQAQSDACILHSKLSHKHNENVRRVWPFLRDRRIDAYSDLLKRFSS